jgi:hypothetical protein
VGEALSPRFFYRWAGGAELGARAKRLDRENDNVRAALEWSLTRGHVATGLRLAIAMSWYWQHRGQFAEGRERLERLVATTLGDAEDALRTRALMAVGDIAVWQGDQERMRSAYEEARRIAEGLADPALLAIAFLGLADVAAIFEGDFRRSHEILTEGLANAERAGDETLAAEIRANMLTYSIWPGNYFLVVPKQHRQIFAAAGWSRKDIGQYVHERARVRRGEWRSVGKAAVAGRKSEDRVYTALRAPDDLLVVAAGGPAGGFGAVIPPWYGTKGVAVTARIDH